MQYYKTGLSGGGVGGGGGGGGERANNPFMTKMSEEEEAEENKGVEGGGGGLTEALFAFAILALAVVGIFVNIACLWSLRRHSSVFHRFLKALAVFDLLVVVCCMWMYSLPALSADFHEVYTCSNELFTCVVEDTGL